MSCGDFPIDSLLYIVLKVGDKSYHLRDSKSCIVRTTAVMQIAGTTGSCSVDFSIVFVPGENLYSYTHLLKTKLS
jgi:hypothetical protein